MSFSPFIEPTQRLPYDQRSLFVCPPGPSPGAKASPALLLRASSSCAHSRQKRRWWQHSYSDSTFARRDANVSPVGRALLDGKCTTTRYETNALFAPLPNRSPRLLIGKLAHVPRAKWLRRLRHSPASTQVRPGRKCVVESGST